MDIKALKEEFGSLKKQNADLISEVSKANRGYTAEEQEVKEKRFARMDEITALVNDEGKLAGYAFAAGKVQMDEPKLSAPAKHEFSAKELREGINQFIRSGQLPQELFGTIRTTGSSAFLPTSVLAPAAVRTAANPYRAILARYGLSTFQTSDTAALKLPLVDDTANVGATKTEGATSETTPVDATPAAIDLSATLYESKPSWFSNSVLLANSFDILGFYLPRLQIRLDRAQHSAIDTVVKAATTSIVTTATASTVTYANLLSWEHSMPVAYRNNLAMVVSDAFYQLLRGLVDSQSRPIMDNDPQNIFQQSIHGIPVYVSEYMSTVATTNKVGALINADSLFLREVVPARLTKYENVPAYPDQVGLNLFQEFAAGVDGSGVRLIKMG